MGENVQLLEYIEKACYNKHIYFWLPVLYVMSNLPLIASFDVKSVNSWVMFGLILVIYSALLCYTIFKRKLPKFKKNEVGIIFLLDMDNPAYRTLVNEKFVKVMRSKYASIGQKYKVIMPDQFFVDIINKKYIETHQHTQLRKKTNCEMMICARCIEGNEKEPQSCIIEILDLFSCKPKVEPNAGFLKREIAVTFKKINHIKILKETETSDFEQYANQLRYAVDYIFASTFLSLGNSIQARNEFLILFRELQAYKKNVALSNSIKSVIRDRIAFCDINLARREIVEYFDDDNGSHLKQMKSYLDESIKYYKETYDYKLLVAIYYFVEKKDIETSLKHIEDCRNISKREGWKFSRVFLKLYKKDGERNFHNAFIIYDKAFKKGISFNFANEIIDFIEWTLKKEPNKEQLYFLLLMLYDYIDDNVSYMKCYREFENKYKHLFLNSGLKGIVEQYKHKADSYADTVVMEETQND